MDQFDLIAKQRQRDLLRKKLDLRKKNGLRYYEPHYKQDKFHRAGARKRRYMRTGNRFGKSDMGAAESCSWAVGYRPWYENTFDVLDGEGNVVRTHEGRKDHPDCFIGIPKRPTKGLIICQDWDKAQEIFTSEEDGIGKGKLFKYLTDLRQNDDGKSPGIVQTRRNSAGGISFLKVRSRWGGYSTIYLDTVRSFKSDGMGQESSNWDWIQIDEPCPEGMWKAAARGLVDAHGSAWFNCTPLRERWINDMFIPSPRTKVDKDNENVFQIKGQDRWIMVGSMHDNPYLSTDAKQEFIADLTEDEIKVRIDGQPAHFQGVIYPQFSYDKHVLYKPPHGWKDMYTPPKNYCIKLSIDPHPRTPHAVLFCAIAPTGEVFFFRKIFEQMLAEDLVKEILDITDGRQVESTPCDWMAFEENPIDGRCMADEFERFGLIVHKAPRALSAGIVATRQALAIPKHLYFMEHLDRTLYEFDSYVWDEKKEKPVDQDDHMMECLYRRILEGVDYEHPVYSDTSHEGYRMEPRHVGDVDLELPVYNQPATQRALVKVGEDWIPDPY